MSRPPQLPALAFSPVVFQPIPSNPVPTSEPGPSRPRTPRFEIVIPSRQAHRSHSPKPLPQAPKSPPQNVYGNLTKEEQNMLKDPDWDVLQAIPCKWQKCDAVLANITIAAKHFAKHMAVLNSVGICGLRRCFHPVNTTSKRKIEQHYLEHHVGPRDPDANGLHTALPKPSDRLPQCGHLLLSVPSYFISVSPVRPRFQNSTNVDMRRKRSGSSSVTVVEQIRFDYGDAPFIPMQGDAIVEVRRHSSYIFPHPAAYSTDPTERALIRQLSQIVPDPSSISRSTDFEVPTLVALETDGGMTSAASVVTSTITSSAPLITLHASSIPSSTTSLNIPPMPEPPTLRTRASFRIVRPIYTGSLPMTIPLADIYADIAKRKRAKGKGRADGERQGGNELDRPSKIRPIAERVARKTVGRTIGVDWWEVVHEVQTALEDAVRPKEGTSDASGL